MTDSGGGDAADDGDALSGGDDVAADGGGDTAGDTTTEELGAAQAGVGEDADPSWVTLFGGTGDEEAWALAVSSAGVYLGGQTTSSWFDDFEDPCLGPGTLARRGQRVPLRVRNAGQGRGTGGYTWQGTLIDGDHTLQVRRPGR